MGRPKSVTSEVVRKLEQAFEDGLNVSEACIQSGISRDTYYTHLNSDDAFSDRMRRSQMSLNSKAKSVIAKSIRKGNLSAARWYLDKERKDTVSEQNHALSMNTGNELDEEQLRKKIQTTINKTVLYALFKLYHSSINSPDNSEYLSRSEVSAYKTASTREKVIMGLKNYKKLYKIDPGIRSMDDAIRDAGLKKNSVIEL